MDLSPRPQRSPPMKPQLKLALFAATVAALGVGGVVRMTDLPEPGVYGKVAPDRLEFGQRRISESLEDSVVFQCNDIGRRSTRFSAQHGRYMEFLMDTLESNRFEVENFEYTVKGAKHQSIIGRREGVGSGTLLIGTHHDSYSKSLCANATATGVATVAELARLLKTESTDKTLIFAYFGTGEKPHKGEDTMGAQVWLDKALKDGETIDQAIIISSFGCFRPGDSGQNSSFPWYLMYPKSTDWVGVYGGFGDNDEVKKALGVWSRVTDLPARGFASPSWMMGIPSTDQVPFQKAGIPTLLFSDTGAERDMNIYSRFDGPYEIPYPEMALRVEALAELVKVYAN